MTRSVKQFLAVLFLLSFGLVCAQVALAGPNAINVAKIQSSFKDWDGTYDEEMNSWTFEKNTTSGDGEDVTSEFYVDAISDDEAGTFDDYAANLMKKDWLDLAFVWTEIDKQEKLTDGFLFIGKSLDYTDPEAAPSLTFLVVRKFRNTSVRCRGDVASAALLNEAVDFCKNLK
jgi:hypothetical protein